MSSPVLWYATRATGLVAVVLLTATTVLGILVTSRVTTRRWPGFAWQELHRRVSLIAMAFLAGHVVTSVTDTYVHIGWAAVVVPFASSYRRGWVTLGTVGLDLLLAVAVTSVLRHRMRARTWRVVHWLAYLSWPVGLAHAFGMGTDMRSSWVIALAVTCMAAVVAAACCGGCRPRPGASGAPWMSPACAVARWGCPSSTSPPRGPVHTRNDADTSQRRPQTAQTTDSEGAPMPTAIIDTTPIDHSREERRARRGRVGTQPPETRPFSSPDRARLLSCWRAHHSGALPAHLEHHGPLPVGGGRSDDAAQLGALVEASGLSGRGGASFPSARKLATVRSAGGSPTVVVNAMEGEPASAKDRTLLSCAPHLVLDGAELVARALHAGRVVVCVPEGSDVCRAVTVAVAERVAAWRAPFVVEVTPVPGRYVAGEESAVVARLNGGPGAPAWRPDKGAPLRIGRSPALVHNAETLAHMALIARYGPDAFRSAGHADAPGTSLVTVRGAVTRPGVFEVAMGTPVGRHHRVGRARGRSRRGAHRRLRGHVGARPRPRRPLHAALYGRGRRRGGSGRAARPPRAGLRAGRDGAHRPLHGGRECRPMRTVCLRSARRGRRRRPAGGGDVTPRLDAARVPSGERGRPRRLPPPRWRGTPRAQRLARLRRRRRRPRPGPALRGAPPAVGAPRPSGRIMNAVRTRIALNPVACEAYGYCAELLPELLSVDEWGYPVVRDGTVPPHLVEQARRAAMACPRRALHVTAQR